MNGDPATRTREHFEELQASILGRLQALDPSVQVVRDAWEREQGGGGLSIVGTGEQTFEKFGVNFSDVRGSSLPSSATATRPALAGRPFRAMGVSVVVHPRNPHLPTTHMNVRFFTTADEGAGDPVWWFGGGFDLTPYYPRLEDVRAWHESAREVCERFDPDWYPRFKAACDAYFYLRHREETRGVGGIFFDDLNAPDFPTVAAFARGVGETFRDAYTRIVERRAATPWTEAEQAFMEYRRGRYVEFNLLYDRGTLFGLQSGGRTESILMSLPPRVSWIYDYRPEPGSAEAELYQHYLKPRDWLGEDPSTSAT